MAPLVIPEKLLQVDNKSNREKIKDLIRKRILENTRKGNLPRAGLPKPFLLGDNIVKIANATAFSTGKRELTLPTVTDKKKEREALLRAMTDETGAARKSVYGKTARKLFKNQEDHHIIFRTLLDKFYKDLPEDEAAELTSAIARRGTASGNVLENLVGVDKDLHQYAKDSIHDWARDVQIEVRKGFPDLNNLDLDGRIDAVTEWLDLIEEPVLDKTAETLAKQDLRRYGSFDAAPAKNKEQWLELFTNQRQNIKARANLLDKYPILAEDLDSPDIRPELKARYDAIPVEDINEWENLTDFQKQQELAWINDPDIRKTLGKPTGEVTEVGRRLGGIGDTITPQPHLLKNTIRNITKTKAFKIGAATTFGVTGFGFDALSTYAGTGQAIKEKDPLRKVAGGLEALSGVSGIASLTPAAPVAVPVSLLSGGVSIALNYAADLKDKGPLTDEERLKKLKQLQLSAL